MIFRLRHFRMKALLLTLNLTEKLLGMIKGGNTNSSGYKYQGGTVKDKGQEKKQQKSLG